MDLWEKLTFLAVKCSVNLQRPINQSTVLHAIMTDGLDELKVNEVYEMVKKEMRDAA